MKKYNCLFFDLDNTIFDFNRSQKETVEKVLKKNSLSYGNFYEIYKINSRFLLSCLGEKTLREHNIECWSKTLKDFGYVGNNFEIFSDDYKKLYGETNYFYNCSKLILKKLHDCFKMGLITNGDRGLQILRLKNAGIDNLFDAFVFAEKDKRKPSVFGFKELLTNLNVKSDEVLMIGDSLKEDFEPCYSLGIDFCWIDRSNYEKNVITIDMSKMALKTRGINMIYKKLISDFKNKI